jgi:hypothetical protein
MIINCPFVIIPQFESVNHAILTASLNKERAPGIKA